jgi:hypothetical protein
MAVKFEYTGKLSDGRYFDNDSTKRVTIELNDNDLNVSEMLEEFMNFMQAIGYKFELGDHLEIVNDLKKNKDELKLDFSKYDVSFTGMDGTSDPGFGAVPPLHD